MKVYKNLMGDNSKINASEIALRYDFETKSTIDGILYSMMKNYSSYYVKDTDITITTTDSSDNIKHINVLDIGSINSQSFSGYRYWMVGLTTNESNPKMCLYKSIDGDTFVGIGSNPIITFSEEQLNLYEKSYPRIIYRTDSGKFEVWYRLRHTNLSITPNLEQIMKVDSLDGETFSSPEEVYSVSTTEGGSSNSDIKTIGQVATLSLGSLGSDGLPRTSSSSKLSSMIEVNSNPNKSLYIPDGGKITYLRVAYYDAGQNFIRVAVNDLYNDGSRIGSGTIINDFPANAKYFRFKCQGADADINALIVTGVGVFAEEDLYNKRNIISHSMSYNYNNGRYEMWGLKVNSENQNSEYIVSKYSRDLSGNFSKVSDFTMYIPDGRNSIRLISIDVRYGEDGVYEMIAAGKDSENSDNCEVFLSVSKDGLNWSPLHSIISDIPKVSYANVNSCSFCGEVNTRKVYISLLDGTSNKIYKYIRKDINKVIKQLLESLAV